MKHLITALFLTLVVSGCVMRNPEVIAGAKSGDTLLYRTHKDSEIRKAIFLRATGTGRELIEIALLKNPSYYVYPHNAPDEWQIVQPPDTTWVFKKDLNVVAILHVKCADQPK